LIETIQGIPAKPTDAIQDFIAISSPPKPAISPCLPASGERRMTEAGHADHSDPDRVYVIYQMLLAQPPERQAVPVACYPLVAPAVRPAT
jgi:hypothetical protein